MTTISRRLNIIQLINWKSSAWVEENVNKTDRQIECEGKKAKKRYVEYFEIGTDKEMSRKKYYFGKTNLTTIRSNRVTKIDVWSHWFEPTFGIARP